MSEGLKREIQNATRDEILAIADLTKRRCIVIADHDLRESLRALDELKPFEDIIATVVLDMSSECILITFHGVKYHVHLHRRDIYSKDETSVSIAKCSALCDTDKFHRYKFDTISTPSSIKIHKRDRPEPQHLAEFVAFMDVLPDQRIRNTVDDSMTSRRQ